MEFAYLKELLRHNVPRFVAYIKERGGVNEEEWQWLKCESDNPECLKGILGRADEYLLYPKNWKTFQQGLFVLVRGLAIMSFIPGGIRFFELHFCSQIDKFVADDESKA